VDPSIATTSTYQRLPNEQYQLHGSLNISMNQYYKCKALKAKTALSNSTRNVRHAYRYMHHRFYRAFLRVLKQQIQLQNVTTPYQRIMRPSS